MDELLAAIITELSEHGIAILASVIVTLLIAFQEWIWDWFKGLFDRSFKLDGYWVGDCYLPHYPRPKLEIWKFTQVGDQVQFTFWDYDKIDPASNRWSGKGVFRVDKCSCFYFKENSEALDTGVLLWRLRDGNLLEGIYAQFDPTNNTPFVSNVPPKADADYYRLHRTTLPLWARVKAKCGLRPVGKYADVEPLFTAAQSAK